MRFLRPNPGECVDRQTILALKIEYGSGKTGDPEVTDNIVEQAPDESKTVVRTQMKNASPVNIQPFIDENEEIQKYLEKNYFPDIAAFADKQKKFDEYFEQLGELNSDLWKLEDQIRILRDAPDTNSAIVAERGWEVAKLIASFNDRRAMMVRQINSLWNIYQVEKLHK